MQNFSHTASRKETASKMGCKLGLVDRVHLSEDRGQRRVLVNAVTNFRVPEKTPEVSKLGPTNVFKLMWRSPNLFLLTLSDVQLHVVE